MDADVTARLDKIDERFDKVDERFDRVDELLRGVAEQFELVEKRAQERHLELRNFMALVAGRFDAVDRRFDALADMWLTQHHKLERRVKRLEGK